MFLKRKCLAYLEFYKFNSWLNHNLHLWLEGVVIMMINISKFIVFLIIMVLLFSFQISISCQIIFNNIFLRYIINMFCTSICGMQPLNADFHWRIWFFLTLVIKMNKLWAIHLFPNVILVLSLFLLEYPDVEKNSI